MIICPQEHHLHGPDTHCGEIGCTCTCLLCVRRRAFWDEAAKDHYKVVGGPCDGVHTWKSTFPGLQEGGVVCCTVPGSSTKRPGRYRREGNKLIYVGSENVVLFEGGPLHGSNYPVKHLTIPENGLLLVPADRGTVMRYRLEAGKLHYVDTVPEAVTTEPEMPFLGEGPGLEIR